MAPNAISVSAQTCNRSEFECDTLLGARASRGCFKTFPQKPLKQAAPSGEGGEHPGYADQIDRSFDVVSENFESRFGSCVFEALGQKSRSVNSFE